MNIVRYNNFGNYKINSLMERKEYIRHIDGIQTHLDVMVIEGKKPYEINEDFSGILNSLGSGFKQTLYQYAAEWILEKMGLPTEGWLMQLAIQIVTKINFLEITNYFGEGSCKYWAKAIQEGLIAFLTHEAGNLILGGMGVTSSNPSERNGIINTLVKTITNSTADGLQKTEFLRNIEMAIGGKLCGSDVSGFSEVFKGKKLSPDEKGKIATKLKKDPESLGQAKGLDILSFFGLNK